MKTQPQVQTVNFKNELLVGLLLVALLVFSRLTSHLWNFTAVGGVALFAGSFFTKKTYAFLVVLGGLLISDLILGFHNQMAWVYSSYALILGLGFLLTVKSPRWVIFSTALAGGILFFLITNFAVWYGGLMYPQTVDGLMQSYIMGLPFFRNQIAADVVSAFILFELAKLPVSAPSTIRSIL